MTPLLKIKLLNGADERFLPAYQSDGAAGMDLRAHIEAPLTLAPHKPCLVPTGIAIALPSADYAAFVHARSGLASKHGIGLSNGVGVVDSDYRGELKVPLINQSDVPYEIAPGERIAQLVIAPVCRVETLVCEELDDTQRGEGGFGSTGRA